LTVLDVQVPDTSGGGGNVAISDQNMGAGFKAYADAHGLSTTNLTGGEVFNLIDGSYTAWQDAVVLFYRPDVGVRDDMAGHVVGQLTAALRAEKAAHAADVARLNQQVATLQAQVAAATTDPVAKACVAALQAVKAAIGEL